MFVSRRWVTKALVLLGCSISTSVSATTFTVNSTTDAVDLDSADGVCLVADGSCSLRAAIQQANASPGADVVVVPAGIYSLTLAGINEDASVSGDLDITSGSTITIDGAGASTVTIDGMKNDRVFQLHSNADLTVNGVTIRDGSASTSGGGIDNQEGQLIVNDSIITANIGAGQGGGINNYRGVLEINRSLISNNLVYSSGGGIMNQDGDVTINYTTIRDNFSSTMVPTFGGGIYNSAMFNTLEINNSTLSGNQAFLDGGAIYHLLGTLRITNTTISGNSAIRYGGGLFHGSGNSTFGIAAGGNKLVNVTITNNIAYGLDNSDPTPNRGGGGLYVHGAVPVQLANTIIAGNGAGDDCSNNGELISLGHNLDGDSTCALGSDASSISAGVAGLGGLADNGGPTQTHALLSNSDALDAGDDSLCPATDQRGYDRPASGCDMGAFEAGAVAPLNPLSAPTIIQTTTAPNALPTVTGDLLTVDAGGQVSAAFQGTDADGDPLTYEILDQPLQGSVGQLAGGSSEFTYVAQASATGSDSFTFRACDGQACSNPAIINISITNAPVSNDVVIQVDPGSGSISGQQQITLPDVDYSQPLGVFRFDINNVPTDPNANINGTVVTIQLSASADIPADAVVRKLNIYQVWETLGSGPDPLLSTATIDAVAKTITLVLRDNDRFDLNRTLGVIEDPVALAIASSSAGVVQVDSSQQSDNTSSETNVTSGSSTAEVSAGGGVLHPLMLALVGLAGLWRRRRY
jgi:CSLREA domain-containing protein/MYXO-CTERM domain-containing protein